MIELSNGVCQKLGKWPWWVLLLCCVNLQLLRRQLGKLVCCVRFVNKALGSFRFGALHCSRNAINVYSVYYRSLLSPEQYFRSPVRAEVVLNQWGMNPQSTPPPANRTLLVCLDDSCQAGQLQGQARTALHVNPVDFKVWIDFQLIPKSEEIICANRNDEESMWDG